MDLLSLHVTSLAVALVIAAVYWISYFGISKKNYFYETLIIFPVSLCFLSIFIPFEIIQVFINVLFFVGFLLGLRKLYRFKYGFWLDQNKSNWHRSSKLEKAVFIFCLVHIFSGLVGTTVLRGQGTIVDAMTYHLGGPKEWALFLNGPKLSLINPESLTASYYEYLIYPLFLILKPLYEYLTPLNSTHFEALNYTVLLVGQLFSGIIGLVFIPKLLWSLFKEKREYFYFALILILGMKGMNWVWKTAKNDAYPLFCSLVAYRYFIRNFLSSKLSEELVFFITFFMVGVGLGAKMTNIYPMLGILSYLLWLHRKEISENYKLSKVIKLLVTCAVAGLLALLPFLLRNYLETTNPLFPTSSTFFENIYLTDSTEAFHHLYSHPTTWSIAFIKLKNLFIDNPGFILLIILSFYLKRFWEPLFFLVLMGIVSKITGERFLWRQISMILFFVLIWSKELYKVYETKFKDESLYFSRVVMIALLALSQFKPERIPKYPYRYYFKTMKETMAENFHAWDQQLKENLKNRGRADFYSKINSYLSRSRHLNLTDSRPEFRRLNEKLQRDKNGL